MLSLDFEWDVRWEGWIQAVSRRWLGLGSRLIL